MERTVSLSTFIDLLKEKKLFFYMGGIFTFIGIFIFLPFTIFAISAMKEPYEKYDSKEILAKGTSAKASVKSIREITNISDNGRHPIEINYVYQLKGKQTEDKFQTLDLSKISELKQGSTVNIKYFNNESVITDLESYSFPIEFLYFSPFMFILPGIVLFSIALFPALKKRKLYKTGIFTDAYFIGMSMFSTTRLNNDRMANVDYYFSKNGSKIFGTSITNEFLPLSLKAKEDIIKVFVNPNDDNQSCYITKRAADKNNWSLKFD